MRLVEIQEGVLLDVDKIEGVKAPDDKNAQTIIYTHHRKYVTTYPYETLVGLLREGEMVDRDLNDGAKVKEVLDKLDKVLPGMGHFAG